MKLTLFLLAALAASISAQDFQTPPSSAGLVKDVPWRTAVRFGDQFRAVYDRCDAAGEQDNFSCPNIARPGKTLKAGCSRDPNRNTAMLRFSNRTIFFDTKMSLDADGSEYSRRHTGNGVDQPQTSLKIKGVSIDSAAVPFIVIPLDTTPAASFRRETGVGLGDLAVVISNGKLSYAIVADEGPSCRIGEGSIRLHENLGHRVCRDAKCLDLRDMSIESDVLYFVFPGTDIRTVPGLTMQTLGQTINSEGKKLFDRLLHPADPK
jgi:hypothetical protein